MKNLIPIVRHDVHGLFDREISGKVVLVTLDGRQLPRMLLEIVETFVRSEHKKGIIISFDRPAQCIRSQLGKFWVPMDELVLVDGVTSIGGLPSEHETPQPRGPRIRVLKDPFDLGCLMTVLKETLLKDFQQGPTRPSTDEEGPAADVQNMEGHRPTLEEELLRSEFELYGIGPDNNSMMRRRLVQRVKEKVREIQAERDHKNGHRPSERAPSGTALSIDEFLASWRDGADFIIIENMATLSAYLCNEDLDELVRGLRTLIAEGLCRSVLILLDKAQYHWITEGLKEGPDIGFVLEADTDMGVTGYRFVPNWNGM